VLASRRRTYAGRFWDLVKLLRILYGDKVDLDEDEVIWKVRWECPVPHLPLIEALLELVPVLAPAVQKIFLTTTTPRVYLSDAMLEISHRLVEEFPTFLLHVPALPLTYSLRRSIEWLKEKYKVLGEGDVYLGMKYYTPDFTSSIPVNIVATYFIRGVGKVATDYSDLNVDSELAREHIKRFMSSVKLLEELARKYCEKATRYVHNQA